MSIAKKQIRDELIFLQWTRSFSALKPRITRFFFELVKETQLDNLVGVNSKFGRGKVTNLKFLSGKSDENASKWRNFSPD